MLPTNPPQSPLGPPEETPVPEHSPPPPPRRRPALSPVGLILLIAVVEILVGLVLAASVPFVLRAVAVPKVFVLDQAYAEGGCVFGVPHVDIQLRLTNSGDADGIARISFYQNGTRLGSSVDWVVPAHSAVDESTAKPILACGDHGYTSLLDSVTKF